MFVQIEVNMEDRNTRDIEMPHTCRPLSKGRDLNLGKPPTWAAIKVSLPRRYRKGSPFPTSFNSGQPVNNELVNFVSSYPTKGRVA
jgi:hypothetical protein